METRKREQGLLYVLYAILVLLALYSIKIALKPSDYTVFLEASSMVASGQSPYNEWIFVSEGVFCFYFYSPLWAILLIPFSYLPDFIPQYLWLLLNVFFLYRVAKLLMAYLDFKIPNLILFILFLMSARFIVYNFEMIQMTLFLVWGGLEALHLIGKERWIVGGALLAFVINVKLLPLVLLPYLIYKGKFKAAVATMAFLVLFLLLPALVVGWDQNLFLHAEWWNSINPANSEHLLETDLGPHSLTALVPVLLTETEGIISLKRNLMDLPVEQGILILNVLRAVFILFTFYFLKWPPFKGELARGWQELRVVSYLFLLIPLIFPHQQKYAFFCIVPALFYCINYWMKIRKTADLKLRSNILLGLLILSFILMTLTTDGVVGRDLNDVFQHYKLITYGALLLIPALVLASPARLKMVET